ncbi:class I SAM-dependent methyltransferase [Patescibacteria group bacterium]|nr:class I SAM-dependent methyltransferase [Patescibacteria group bacterium]
MKKENSNLQEAYNQRSFDKAPKIYRDISFAKLIYRAIGLNETSVNLKVLDLMSGPGKLARELAKQLPATYYCLDFAGSQLSKISPEVSTSRILAEVQSLPIEFESFDVVVVRFGIKDLTIDAQPSVIAGLFRILKPNGCLIVADMMAPEGADEWLNTQHALKQELGGRNPQIEGKCNIPSEAEWIGLLENAGFQAEVFERSVSCVNTNDWKKSKQVSGMQLVKLNKMIKDAPDHIKRVLNIRQDSSGLKIDYPLVVLKAIKLSSEKTN